MNPQTATKMVRIKKWAAQITACQQSGLTVRQWCHDNDLNTKTYYNRVRRVREEMLESLGKDEIMQMTEVSSFSGKMETQNKQSNTFRQNSLVPGDKPVFAALPLTVKKNTDITVRMGEYEIGIQNGADDELVAQVLRTVSRL